MRRSGATNSETERGREDLLSGGKTNQFREIKLSRFSKKEENNNFVLKNLVLFCVVLLNHLSIRFFFVFFQFSEIYTFRVFSPRFETG